MESNIEALKSKRIEVLKDIVEVIESWDKTNERGIEIIESVDLQLQDLKKINNQLELGLGNIAYDEEYEDFILITREKYKDLIKALDGERESLLDLIKEIKLKEKIKNSYILTQNDSVFIDKDL